MSKYLTLIKCVYVGFACKHFVCLPLSEEAGKFMTFLWLGQRKITAKCMYKSCCKWLLIHILPLFLCVCVWVQTPCSWFAVFLHGADMWGVNREHCCRPTADQIHIRRRQDDKQSKQNLILGAITSVCLIFGTGCRKLGSMTLLDSPFLAGARIGIITH